MTSPATMSAGRGSYDLLLIDDDVALLETTRAVLELHHTVTATTNPVEALRILEDRTFHVVISDWMMPGMDGIEFFRRAWRSDPSLTGLLITARMQEFADEVHREDRKMLGLLAKPFSGEQLLTRVEHLGRLSSMKREVSGLRKRER